MLVIFALAAIVGLWRWQQRPQRTPAPAADSPRGGAAVDKARSARGAAVDQPAPPTWFVPDGAKARRIAGRVTLDGKPAGNATVTLANELTRAGRNKAVVITAGTDGTFDLGTWPGGTYTIAATAPGVRAATMPIEGARIGADGFAVAETDATGAYSICVPWGDLGITPQEWARDRPMARNAVTDASGRFRIEGLVPGRYRGWAFAAGLSSEGASPVEAQLGVTNEVVIKLVERTRIRGTVLLDGKPLPGVTVAAVRHVPTSRSRPARTLLDGAFVLDDVPGRSRWKARRSGA